MGPYPKTKPLKKQHLYLPLDRIWQKVFFMVGALGK